MSTDSRLAIEELDRDELEARVRDLEPVGAVVAKLVNELRDAPEEDRIQYDDPEFVPIAAQTFTELADQLHTHDSAIDRHESVIQESKTAGCDTSDHWWAVVEAAHNLQGSPNHGLPDNWVKLYRENIAQATGLSAKRGQQLIDEWADDDSRKHKRGTKKQAYDPGSAANNNESQRKALFVDLNIWEVDK